jgi:hypothetical protein
MPRKYSKEYYQNNKEAYKGYRDKWAAENKEQLAEAKKKYRVENRDKINQRMRNRKRKMKDKIIEIKKNSKCIRCGFDDARALQFHHINPSDKLFAIGNRYMAYTWDIIQKEIDKCEILCANCHSIEHYEP